MSRAIITAERFLPHDPIDLCRLVGDVREYPKFVPWLKSLRITKEEPRAEGGWEGVAEAIVGWKAITERFATQVRCEPAKGEVDVSLNTGPLHALENRWRFTPYGLGGTKVNFWIAYQFKNPLLQAAINANKERLGRRVMEAFEAEANRRLART